MNRARFVVSAAASIAVVAAARPAAAADPVAARFPVAGGTLGYRRFGTGGPLHVLLSGGPGLESAYVDPVAVELSRDRTIVLLDQRGTGTSRDALGDGSQLSIAGAVADLDALRTALGLRRLSLLGHSWGAMLSMAYAAAHGDRVAALALLDPGGPDPSFYKTFGEIISARLTDADRAAIDAAQKSGQGTELAILPGYFQDHAKGVAYAAAMPQHYVNPDVTRFMVGDLRAHYDVKDGLRDTPIPTLVLYGTGDPARAAESPLDALFPRATKVMIADAGHFPWAENPVPFYAAVRAFLNGVPAS
jgi:pimeloyl-ACP methyl ester carboxylesterase